MNFTIAYYTNLRPFNSVKIPIGIVIQTPQGLIYKFDLSETKFNKIREISPNADSETFKKFEESFKASYLDVDSIEITDDNGQKITIKSSDPRFIPYLNTTYQNYYQYSRSTPIEANNPEVLLDLLFKQIVNPSSDTNS